MLVFTPTKWKSFKGVTFKGLDITFGKEIYGGMIIRAIQSDDNKIYIDGPCNVVNHILKLTNKISIYDLVLDEKFN